MWCDHLMNMECLETPQCCLLICTFSMLVQCLQNHSGVCLQSDFWITYDWQRICMPLAMSLLRKCRMQMCLSRLPFMFAMLVFQSVRASMMRFLSWAMLTNFMCAGCQTEGILIQLYAFFESHANLAKYFYQCLLSNCRYPLPHLSRCYNNWFGACDVCDCPGKPSLLDFKGMKTVLCFCVQ